MSGMISGWQSSHTYAHKEVYDWLARLAINCIGKVHDISDCDCLVEVCSEPE